MLPGDFLMTFLCLILLYVGIGSTYDEKQKIKNNYGRVGGILKNKLAQENITKISG